MKVETFLPGKVAEVGVNRSTNHFTFDFPEILRPVAECNDFSWTDKGEIKRIEEEHHIFA